MRRVFCLFVFACMLLVSGRLQATHLRAAEIVAERLSLTQYEISLFVYSDSNSVEDGSGTIEMDFADIMVNEEVVTVPRDSVRSIGNETFVNVYRFTYEFPSVNAIYRISFQGINRNEGIENIQAPSQDNPLYVETMIFLDATSTENSTPQLTVPPIDLAAVGEVYTHNPGAFDPDGDSIAFRMLVPKVSELGVVPEYRFPDDPSFGSASYTLDAQTGDVVWDAPNAPGEYNIAIMIEEWRNGIRIGYVIRDMQIIVFDSENDPPVVVVPQDTCVIATEGFVAQILAYDENDHTIVLEQFGGYTGLGDTLSQIALANDSILAISSWVPSCDHIRDQPYVTIFKATDVHPVKLSTLESWEIDVHGPAPQNLNAVGSNEGIQLNWDAYPCQGDNVRGINIYRRSCDSGMVEMDPCTPGVDPAWGYEQVVTVDVSDTSYFDDNDGDGLVLGQHYCYLLEVDFRNPSSGVSFASNVACSGMVVEVPLITNASVQEHDSIAGDILLSWVPPIVLPANSESEDWDFELYRGNGVDGTPATLIHSFTGRLDQPGSFEDIGIPTFDTAYTYRLDVTDPSDQFFGSSEVVSSINLIGLGESQRADLNWGANANWFFPDSLYHYVYAFTDSGEVLVDSLQGSLLSYSVNSLENGDTFCFYVETQSVFCNDSLEEVYTNVSNAVCVIPVDTSAPCPPVLSILANDCENFEFGPVIQNELFWFLQSREECDSNNITKFHIYFSPPLEEYEFVRIETLEDSSAKAYVHDSLEQYKGCYVITAEDAFGNESDFSNVVCNDNCEYFELPNIFTPNGDNKNDKLFPLPEPRFVQSVEFFVYNRWGNLVYYSDDDPDINWDGKDTEGNDVSDGLYFYLAKVFFDKLELQEAPTEFKGWVMVSR